MSTFWVWTSWKLYNSTFCSLTSFNSNLKDKIVLRFKLRSWISYIFSYSLSSFIYKFYFKFSINSSPACLIITLSTTSFIFMADCSLDFLSLFQGYIPYHPILLNLLNSSAFFINFTSFSSHSFSNFLSFWYYRYCSCFLRFYSY